VAVSKAPLLELVISGVACCKWIIGFPFCTGTSPTNLASITTTTSQAGDVRKLMMGMQMGKNTDDLEKTVLALAAMLRAGRLWQRVAQQERSTNMQVLLR
jgi:hypothetical protein